MKLPRRRFLQLAVAAAAAPALPQLASALDYPTRPVRLIVGFPVGTATDIDARLIAQFLSERLGQQFIVDNRPGAAGNIGTEAAVRAPADGYTLLAVTSITLSIRRSTITSTSISSATLYRLRAPFGRPTSW